MLETEADYAIDTPYFPEYRIGLDNSNICGEPTPVLEIVESSADLNNDGEINDADLQTLFSLLGTCRSDVNSSGDIEFGDIIEVLSNFGNVCE